MDVTNGIDAWINGGPVGLLIIIIVLFARGHLIPASIVDRIVKIYSDHNDQLAQALKHERQRGDEQDAQIIAMLQAGYEFKGIQPASQSSRPATQSPRQYS